MGAALLFLRGNWKLVGLGLLVLTLAIQTVRLGHRTNQLEAARINLNECREGRKADREAYRQAQADAKAKNEAEVRRIETEQQRITDDVESNLGARLERLRRELRAKDAAPQGSASGPETGRVPETPGGTDGAPRLCSSPEQLLRAAENEERHDQLISWVERQLGVKR